MPKLQILSMQAPDIRPVPRYGEKNARPRKDVFLAGTRLLYAAHYPVTTVQISFHVLPASRAHTWTGAVVQGKTIAPINAKGRERAPLRRISIRLPAHKTAHAAPFQKSLRQKKAPQRPRHTPKAMRGA